MSNQHSSAFKTKNDVLIETLLKDILNKIKEYTKDDIEVVEESENSFDVDALYSEFESFDTFFNTILQFEFSTLPLDFIDSENQIQTFSKNLNNPKLEAYQKAISKVSKTTKPIGVHPFILTFPILLMAKALITTFSKKDFSPDTKENEPVNPSEYLLDVDYWENTIEDGDNSTPAIIYKTIYWKLNAIKHSVSDFLEKALIYFPNLKRFDESKRSELLLDKITEHYQNILRNDKRSIRVFNCFKLPYEVNQLFTEAVLCILEDYKLEQKGELHDHLAKNESSNLRQAKRGSGNATKLSQKETAMLMRLLQEKGVVLDNLTSTLYAGNFSQLTGYSKNTLRSDISYSAKQIAYQAKGFDNLINVISEILEELKGFKN